MEGVLTPFMGNLLMFILLRPRNLLEGAAPPEDGGGTFSSLEGSGGDLT